MAPCPARQAATRLTLVGRLALATWERRIADAFHSRRALRDRSEQQVIEMAQNEKDNQSVPRERRVVTEQELMEALNRSLWEVERRRVQEHGPRNP